MRRPRNVSAVRAIPIGPAQPHELAARARGQGVERAYMMTRTIVRLAGTWGFRVIGRDEVPAAILGTSQFRGGHCASAVIMRRVLAEQAKVMDFAAGRGV